jgi:Sulfotransferase family
MPQPMKQRLLQAYRILRGVESPKIANREIRREIPPISDEEVAEAKSFFPLEKYFIFGHARSGTTMLARLIRLHPEVHCNYQAHFFTRAPLLESLVADEEVGAWLKRNSNRWNHGKDLSPVVLRVVADYILEREARLEGKRIVGDKSPSSLLDGQAVRLMHKVYPDARLIYLIRDGRDTVISHRFQAFIDFPQHLTKEDLKIRADFAESPEPFLSGKRSIFTEQSLIRAAEGWVRNINETEQLGKQLYGERYFSLRYEDLLEHPWEEMGRVWDFLGAVSAEAELQPALEAEMTHNPDADWQQQKAKEIAQPLQGIAKGKRGSWLEIFTPQDRVIFHGIAAEMLRTWGYPVDDELSESKQ